MDFDKASMPSGCCSESNILNPRVKTAAWRGVAPSRGRAAQETAASASLKQ